MGTIDMKKFLWTFILLGIIIVSACKEDTVYTPKPRMFPKVDYPEKSYITFDQDYCAMKFQMPAYAVVEKDTAFFDEKPAHPCWFDLYMKDFNGRLHFSYYPIEGQESYDKLVGDAFEFVEKHDIKANYRQETTIENKHGLSGILFDLEGPVASPIQFFLTDSTDHFIRASVYFYNQVEPDSMAPIYDYISEDVARIIETMSF